MLWLSRALPCHNKREVIGWFTAVRLSIRMTLVCYKTCEPAKRILSLNVREPASSVCVGVCVCVKYVPFVIHIYIYTYTYTVHIYHSLHMCIYIYIYVDIDIAIELYPHMVSSVLSGAIWCYLVLSGAIWCYLLQLRASSHSSGASPKRALIFSSAARKNHGGCSRSCCFIINVLQYVYVSFII